MVRLTIIILCLTGIGAGLVHLRRQEVRLRYEIQRGHGKQLSLRRRLWDQRVRIGHLMAPAEVRKRVREMALDLTEEDESRSHIARAGAEPARGAEATQAAEATRSAEAR